MLANTSSHTDGALDALVAALGGTAPSQQPVHDAKQAMDVDEAALAPILNVAVQTPKDVVELSAVGRRHAKPPRPSPEGEAFQRLSMRKIKLWLGARVDKLGKQPSDGQDEKEGEGEGVPNPVFEQWVWQQQTASALGETQCEGLVPFANPCNNELLSELGLPSSVSSKLASLCRALALAQRRHVGGEGGVRVRASGSFVVEVVYGKQRLEINKLHFQKLRRQFAAFGSGSFEDHLYCLLQRYRNAQGGSFEGGGFQAAINEECFEVLHEHLGCHTECFASPLNCYFERYCSAFEDTDAPFGSLGSFFKFRPTHGSFEANPPFVPEVMTHMAAHMDALLRATSSPLSFVVIVPAWDQVPGYRAMSSSQFLRRTLQLLQAEHGYRIATADTTVFFLQNATGSQKWPVTDECVEALRAAFASKHESREERKAAKQQRNASKRALTGPPPKGRAKRRKARAGG